MKRYLKNKDFIPEKFCNKVELSNNKKENKIIILFLIINLFLIPITAKNIYAVKEKTNSHTDSINNIKQNSVQLDDINIWVENIVRDDIEEAYINNNNGEIVVSDLNKIDELSTNTLIEINDINLNNDNKYKLGVSLNE